jgi:hypothetical protein
MDKYKYMEMAKSIIKELNIYNPYIHAVSSHGSIYIKFKNLALLRTIRIGDHNGRFKYRYKWNLRSDILKSHIEMDRWFERFYYTFEDTGKMVKDICNYYNKIYKD